MDFKDFPWTRYNVKFAILFGSWVTGKVIKGDWFGETGIHEIYTTNETISTKEIKMPNILLDTL
jgi:hypothetical protein